MTLPHDPSPVVQGLCEATTSQPQAYAHYWLVRGGPAWQTIPVF